MNFINTGIDFKPKGFDAGFGTNTVTDNVKNIWTDLGFADVFAPLRNGFTEIFTGFSAGLSNFFKGVGNMAKGLGSIGDNMTLILYIAGAGVVVYGISIVIKK